jgi:Zn-dependent protease
MLFEPDRTPYDLNWRMFGVPVRVHPLFWLLSALLGFNAVQNMLVQENRPWVVALLLVWIACVFVSILLHEFGHVAAGLLFGARGHIVLYSFGGLAIGSSDLPRRWQRVIVYAAGPAVQLVLWGGLQLVMRTWPDRFPDPGFALLLEDRTGALLGAMMWMLLEINLWWPVMNLLPVWPLDGGKISREVFDWFMPGRGVRTSLGLSLTVAGALAVLAIAEAVHRPLIPYNLGGWWMAILFGMFAFNNYQEMQTTSRGRYGQTYERRAPWEQDPDYWKR